MKRITFSGSHVMIRLLYFCFNESTVISSKETPKMFAASMSFILRKEKRIIQEDFEVFFFKMNFSRYYIN